MQANGPKKRGTYTYSDALAAALRSDGDFLVWSEVKDGFSGHALTLAMSTGTKGPIANAGAPPAGAV